MVQTADKDAENSAGNTALILASWNGHADVMRALLDAHEGPLWFRGYARPRLAGG